MKGFILFTMMIYVALSIILCNVMLHTVRCFLTSYQRLNTQGSLARSMIMGSALLSTISINTTAFIKNGNLYWRYPWQNDTHALVLKKNILWYMQGSYQNDTLKPVKRRIALMHYVKEVLFKPTQTGIEYRIQLTSDAMVGVL